MELLKVILWQVAVTFNLPTTDPEAKIKVFPTTYFQMLSLLQSTERASSSQVSSECSYSFLLRLSWLLCKVIKFFLHSTWRAWWYDLMWVLSVVGGYSWWGFKNPPALRISWPCHHLIWYLGVKPWGRAIFLMRCHYLISSWSKIHDYAARCTPYHLLMLLSRKSQIHNFSEEHSWVYGWCLCKCLQNHNVVESSWILA